MTTSTSGADHGRLVLPNASISNYCIGFILGYLIHAIDFVIYWRTLTDYTSSNISKAYFVNPSTEEQVFNIFCTSSSWGVYDSLLVFPVAYALIILNTFRGIKAQKRIGVIQSTKILFSLTAAICQVSLSIDIVKLLRSKVLVSTDGTGYIFKLSRSLKAKLFIRAAHLHIIIYVILLIISVANIFEPRRICSLSKKHTSPNKKKD